MTKKPTCNCFSADGWREVKPGEIIEKGDQYYAYGKWNDVIYSIGKHTKLNYDKFRTRRHLANCPAVKETETPKSETPRTDKEVFVLESQGELYPVTASDFARQLERELNEAKADADKWMQRAGEDQEAYLEVAKQLTTTQQRLAEMTEMARDACLLLDKSSFLLLTGNDFTESVDQRGNVLRRLKKLEELK